uniref:Uncharacterized protein n=1 Tax=Glossina palpalis gambiensis TaxID=67801 RepID=A0A1B0ANV3_9MUSC
MTDSKIYYWLWIMAGKLLDACFTFIYLILILYERNATVDEQNAPERVLKMLESASENIASKSVKLQLGNNFSMYLAL